MWCDTKPVVYSNLYYSIMVIIGWVAGVPGLDGDWFRSPAGPPSSCLVVRSVLSNIWVSVASLGGKRVEKMGSKWSQLQMFEAVWRIVGTVDWHVFEVFEQGRGFLWFLATNFPGLAHAKMYPQNHSIQGVAKSLAVLQFYGPNLWPQNVACGGSEVWQLSFGEVCCSAPGLPEVLCGSSDALHGLWDGQVPSEWMLTTLAVLKHLEPSLADNVALRISSSERIGNRGSWCTAPWLANWHMYIKVQPPKPISNAIILAKTRNRLRPWADSRW